jgi:hypothetical protein
MYEQPLHMQHNSSTSGFNATRDLQGYSSRNTTHTVLPKLIAWQYGASQCGAQSKAVNPFLSLFFVPIFTYDGLVTSQEQPQHTTNCRKHGNHGGGAAHPSSNEDSINPLDLLHGRFKGGVG